MLRAILRKSFILKCRSPKTTICQWFSAPLFAYVLVLAYSFSSKEDIAATSYAALQFRLAPVLAAALDMGLDFNVQPSIQEQYHNRACAAGSVVYDGRLEVFHGGEWGTVCDDSFGFMDAWIACSQLGLEPYTVERSDAFYRLPSDQWGAGSSKIWLDDLRCSGAEARLADCGSNGWGQHDCHHFEDAGVSCLAPTGSPPRSLSGEGAVRLGGVQARTGAERRQSDLHPHAAPDAALWGRRALQASTNLNVNPPTWSEMPHGSCVPPEGRPRPGNATEQRPGSPAPSSIDQAGLWSLRDAVLPLLNGPLPILPIDFFLAAGD